MPEEEMEMDWDDEMQNSIQYDILINLKVPAKVPENMQEVNEMECDYTDAENKDHHPSGDEQTVLSMFAQYLGVSITEQQKIMQSITNKPPTSMSNKRAVKQKLLKILNTLL